MATIQKYGAPGVYDPSGYSQAIKVTGAQTILSWPARFRTRPTAP
jgi:hypothetical protein